MGGVAQAVGSGLWRAKSFFSSGPKLPFKRLTPRTPQTPQTLRHLPWLCQTSRFWTLQTPIKRLKPLKPRTSRLWALDTCQTGCAILAVGAASFWILDASDAPKPRTCQTVGSGLCETVGGVAQAVGSGLWRAKSFFSSGPKLPFKRLKPLLNPSNPSNPSNASTLANGCAIRLDSGRFRRSMDASDAPKPRTCQTVGSGLCETVGGVAQAVGSGLWRAKSFFSSGPKLPFKRLKPLKPLRHLPWLCHTSGF